MLYNRFFQFPKCALHEFIEAIALGFYFRVFRVDFAQYIFVTDKLCRQFSYGVVGMVDESLTHIVLGKLVDATLTFGGKFFVEFAVKPLQFLEAAGGLGRQLVVATDAQFGNLTVDVGRA